MLEMRPVVNTRKYVHKEAFDVVPEKLFLALHTPSAIRSWWGASRAIVIAQEGGMWAAAWGDREDDPDSITSAVIAAFDPPRRLVLDNVRSYVRQGPLPFEVLFVTEFLVTPVPHGCNLKITQDGFPMGPEGDEFLESCARGWMETCQRLRDYLNAMS